MTRRSHVVRTGEQAGTSQLRTLADEAPPPPPPSLPEILWGIPGAIYPQHSATWTTSVDCVVSKLVVTFLVAPTGGTTTLELFKNGGRVWQANVPANMPIWLPTISPFTSVMDQTVWQLRCTSVGTGGPTGMGVAVRYG
jgi:hypothetical protein